MRDFKYWAIGGWDRISIEIGEVSKNDILNPLYGCNRSNCGYLVIKKTALTSSVIWTLLK